jgi:hypothetical protein
MCKSRIEDAANKRREVKANWDITTKLVTLIYDSTKTNANEILKRIAYAGYDNEQFIAPHKVYLELPQCCQYHRNIATNTSPERKNENNMQPDLINSENRNILTEVYASYFDLKNALTKDDQNDASLKAAEFLKVINKVSSDKMSKNEDTAWMKNKGNLITDAEHIKESSKIELQREFFISLSKEMYTIAKVFKNDTAIYYQHCPMVSNGKGANWLSEQKEIKNPYMGKVMLSCGTTLETIKN